jgi:hypothetical protein
MLSWGGDEAGLQFHEHGASWLALVYGMKRWFVYKPGGAGAKQRGHPLHDAKTWLQETYPHLGTDAKPLECVQHATEIMYLPAAWAHLTYNYGETIGVGAQATWNPKTDGKSLLAGSKGGDPEATMWIGMFDADVSFLGRAAGE